MSQETALALARMDDKKLGSGRIIGLSVFVAASITAHILESQLVIGSVVPGVKFGLANIFAMLVLIYYGPPAALIVILGRVIGGALMNGTLLQLPFLFSLCGALVSYVVLILAYKIGKIHLSFVGISVLAASAHNLTQLFIAAAVIGSMAIWSLIPALLLSAVFFGSITGTAVNLVTARLSTYLPRG